MITQRVGEPEPSAEQALWNRLRNGDPTAPTDLATTYLDPLADWLTKRYPRVDPHLCESAAVDALMALIKNPASYIPARGALWPYLRMSAEGDLKNHRQTEKKHTVLRTNLEVVELSPRLRKYLQDDRQDPARIAELREEVFEAVKRRAVPREVIKDLSPAEAKGLCLILAGERRTSVYARALGIENDPIETQRREVKQMKDRLL